MIVYQPHSGVPDGELVDPGPPEGLGGKALAGAPWITARIDLQAGGAKAGIFEAATGTVEVTFPFTKHATILTGEVTIADQAGRSHTYRPGDSHLISEGQVVRREVQGERVRKSFFNIRRTGPA